MSSLLGLDPKVDDAFHSVSSMNARRMAMGPGAQPEFSTGVNQSLSRFVTAASSHPEAGKYLGLVHSVMAGNDEQTRSGFTPVARVQTAALSVQPEAPHRGPTVIRPTGPGLNR